MKKVVFVRRPGGSKRDDSWICSHDGDARILANWLRHLGVLNVEIITLDQYHQLPDRQPSFKVSK